MTNQIQNKILLAIDGSEYAQNAVKYVGELGPFQKMEVVLFNVFGAGPESYLDLEKDLRLNGIAREVKAWEMHQRKVIKKSMDNAKQTLIRSGIPQKAVTVKIQNRIKGIARDIINEAQAGYNAVVVGRKGMDTFQEIVMGSVTTKIVHNLAFPPLLMIGSIPPDKKILVALDRSETAMRAVNFVAETLGGYDFKITLFHVIRNDWDFQSGIANFFLPKASLEQAEKEMEKVFARAKQHLVEAGFKPDQITAKVVSGVHSRAGSIVNEARAGDYGTIVLGRRGISIVEEFVMGRVGNKVINTIRNRAVWVVT